MILETLLTVTLISSAGAGDVPAPDYTYPTPPEVDAVALWEQPEGEHTHEHSHAAQGDTGPPSDVWSALANCESSGRWDYNGGSGFDGGLQFLPSTWTAFKSGSHPDYAYQATPAQQIEVARRVAAAQGAGAWPSCTAKLGITTEDLLQ